MVGSALGVFAYVAGNAVFSNILDPFHSWRRELTVICAALAEQGSPFSGSTPTGRSVHGDVGAWHSCRARHHAVGQQEIVAVHQAGVRCGTLSVMLQVPLQAHGKRIFRMAPLHHHYE